MNKTKIAVDACCIIKNANLKGRGSKGKSACGVVVIDEKGDEHTFCKYLGEMTVPEAEFNGLIFALDQAAAICRYSIEVWMDSELVIKWMIGEYRMRKDHIRPLFDKAKKYEQRYKSVEYFHHSRKSNLAKKADLLARKKFEECN